MTRGLVAKVTLGALAALACVDAAQAGLIFRRGNRRGNDCYQGGGYMSSGSMGGGYAYSGSMYGQQYVSGPMYAGMGPTTSAYVDPYSVPAAAGPVAADKARVKIRVPSADVRLWINNNMVHAAGTERVFDLPLNAGQPTKYTVTAQWMKDGREFVAKKEIEARAGQEADVAIAETDGAMTNTEKLPVTPNPEPPKPNPPNPNN
jgi:uncharacterized protein (TIGR03000 family)